MEDEEINEWPEQKYIMWSFTEYYQCDQMKDS
jgi:hypothetical protein